MTRRVISYERVEAFIKGLSVILPGNIRENISNALRDLYDYSFEIRDDDEKNNNEVNE